MYTKAVKIIAIESCMYDETTVSGSFFIARIASWLDALESGAINKIT